MLAVGLPLAWVKTQAAEWRNYLMREKNLDFSFRKERYKVHLCGLEIFSQGIGDRTDAVALTTKRIAENYTTEIMKKLTAQGYREEQVHLFIIGGGGCLLQNFSDLTAKPEVTVITDICANAKGY